MSYLALARKWRPHKFTDLVGQDHVVKALSNALDNNRVHHAYLFTGTRGIGKTTIARIFAKSLNCLTNGISSNPCNTCDACISVDEGRFVDLIEIDAASNTKVDDTREILDNVQYAPTSARYKIYLIDEVHMLSTHSFNALLKTLEEPPEHVKFILATTDPQKLPVTILSRCLQFFLKPLTLSQISDRLDYVLGEEGIVSDKEGLQLIARAGQGSMRDSLSLLDQAIVYGDNQVVAKDVRDMLGLIEHRYVQDIFAALVAQDFSKMMATVALIHQKSPDYSAVLDELLTAFHHLSILQFQPDMDDETLEDKAWLSAFISAIDKASLQMFYQMVLKGKQDINLAPDVKMGFEMVLLRLFAFKPMMNPSQLEAVSQNNASSSTQDTDSAEKKTVKFDRKKDSDEFVTEIAQKNSPDSVISASLNTAVTVDSTNTTADTIPTLTEPSIDVKKKPIGEVVDISNANNSEPIQDLPDYQEALDQAEADLAQLDEFEKPGSDHVVESVITQTKSAGLAKDASIAPGSESPIDGKLEKNINNNNEAKSKQADVITPKVHKGSVEDFSDESWHQLVPKLGLSVMTRELFMSSVFISLNNNQLEVLVDEDTKDLIETIYINELQDALLAYSNENIVVNIGLREANSNDETPNEKRIRESKMRMQYAENTMREDSNVKFLVDSFDAEIIKGSIKFIEN